MDAYSGEDHTPQPLAAEAAGSAILRAVAGQGTIDHGGRGSGVRFSTVVLILVFTVGALYMLFSPLVTRLLAVLNESVPRL